MIMEYMLKLFEFLKKWLISTDPSSISQLLLFLELYFLTRLLFIFLERLINEFFLNRTPYNYYEPDDQEPDDRFLFLLYIILSMLFLLVLYISILFYI